MSLTLKLTSLVIRTAAKPIGNYIKQQAREHERFRRICIQFAQRLHRVDMRLRLGLLQDPAAIDRQIAREAAEAEKARQRREAPTVRTEEEQKAEEARKAEEKKKIGNKVKSEKEKEKDRRMRMVRPLSEAKAIDSGANFISEAFLFAVATGLILFETFRSRRKEASRREDVRDRLEDLEEEIRRLRGLQEGEEVVSKEVKAPVEDSNGAGAVKAEKVEQPEQQRSTSSGEQSQEEKEKRQQSSESSIPKGTEIERRPEKDVPKEDKKDDR